MSDDYGIGHGADSAGAESLQLRVETGTHSGTITHLAVDPLWPVVVSAGRDKRVRLWHGPEPLDLTGRLGSGDVGRVEAVTLALGGLVLVAARVGTGRSVLRCYEAGGGELLQAVPFDGVIVAMAVAQSDAADLVVAIDDGTQGRLELHRLLRLVFGRDEIEDELPDFGAAGAPVATVPLAERPAAMALAPVDDGDAKMVVVTSVLRAPPQRFRVEPPRLEPWPFEHEDDLPAVGRAAAVAIGNDLIVLAGEDSGLTVLSGDGLPIEISADLIGAAGRGRPAGVALSPDGTLLAVGSRAGDRSLVTVHDVLDRFEIVGSRPYDDDASVVGFLADDRVVSAGGSRHTIRSWNPWSKEDRDGDRAVIGAGQTIDAVGLHGSLVGLGRPDGPGVQTAAAAMTEDPGSVEHLPPHLRPLEQRFDLDRLILHPPAAEADVEVPLERFARAAHDGVQDRSLVLDGGQLYLDPEGEPLTGHGRFQTHRPTAFALVPRSDGPPATVVGDRSGTVRVLLPDGDGGLAGRTLIGHGSAVLDVAVDGAWIATSGRDQVVRLWSRRAAVDLHPDPTAPDAVLDPALNLFVAASDEWILWSRSGYYASSPYGDQLIEFHLDTGDERTSRSLAGDRFVKHLYRPDVIRAILETGSEEAALTSLGMEPVDLVAAAPPIVELLEESEELADGTFELVFEVVESRSPTTSIWVLQNGVPAFEVTPQPAAPGTTVRYRTSVLLEPGENQLTIVAENEVARATPARTSTGGPSTVEARSPLLDGVSDVSVEEELIAEAIVSEEVIAEEDLADQEVGIDEDTGAEDEDGALTADGVAAAPEPPGSAVAVDASASTAELVVRFRAAEEEVDLAIAAARNGEEVWRADVAAGVSFEAALTIPLTGGQNDVVVTAEDPHSGEVHADLLAGWIDLNPARPVVIDGPEVGGMQDAPGPGPRPVPERGPTTEPAPVPDDWIRHTVTAGETASDIVRTHLGDGAKVAVLFAANPSIDPMLPLPVGFEVRLPPPVDADPGDGSEDEIDLSGEDGAERDPASGPVPGNEAMSVPGSGTKGTGTVIQPPAEEAGKPNLYLLSMGVTELLPAPDQLADLRWTGDDAISISERFAACQGVNFGLVERIGRNGSPYIVGREATKANIEQGVDDLAATVRARAAAKRSAGDPTTDITVLFFSGHGVARPEAPPPGTTASAGATPQGPEGLYLIPHDHDPARWRETSVSLVEISETLSSLPKTELVILIDACRSGFAGTSLVRKIQAEQFGKRLESITPRTIYVLSSTARELDSYEYRLKSPYDPAAPNRTFVGHGLFTHAILKRLDEADARGEALSVLELGAAIHRQFDTWRSWQAFARRNMRQDPWYRFYRDVRHFDFYKR
ncbi:MAG: caspase family protein [Actinomycetota bacterium]